MKREEKIALDYLRTDSDDVIYEPDGNTPPDFLLNHITAIEVRRLSKNIFYGNSVKSIEQDGIRLRHALARVLREFDTKTATDNYWIYLKYSRPIGRLSEVISKAKLGLTNFVEKKPQTAHEIKLSHNVSFSIIKANRKSSQVFRIGMESDLDNGGFVASMYMENINHCIKEKTKKIQSYRYKYADWWLILVDFLVGTIGEPEITTVLRNINKPNSWRKIIVINPETKKEIISLSP